MEDYFLYLNRELMRFIALDLLLIAPVVALLSQVALAIREIAINTRKEMVTDEDYKILYWIATIFTYLSISMVLASIVLFLKSC